MVQSMQGSPAHVIAEDFGFSESTGRRRIQEARDSVRDELALHVDDGAEVPLRGRDRSRALALTALVRGDVRGVAQPGTGPGPGQMRPSFDREPMRPSTATAGSGLRGMALPLTLGKPASLGCTGFWPSG